jgi:hypothetical protein
MVAGVRPMYAPALVAFVGGPRFGVAIAVGGGGGMAAWFPLGPGEVYRPAYQVSAVYVTNINVMHVSNVAVINQVNVTNVHYMNQGVPGAVMVVPHDAFVGARPVNQAAVRMDAREFANAPVAGTPGFAPQRESVLAGPVRTNVPPARFEQRSVVMKAAAPPPPVSFAAKQQALEANGGRPLDANTMNNLRANGARTPGAAGRNTVPAARNDRPGAANDRPPGRSAETPRTTTTVPPKNETPAVKAEPRQEPPAKNDKKAPNKKATKK